MVQKTATSNLRAWDRQKDENEEDWKLFQLYLVERNLMEVVRQHYPEAKQNAGKSYAVVAKKDHNWDNRVKAYDRWTMRIKDDAKTELIREEVKLIGKKRINLLKNIERKYHKVSSLLDKAIEAEVAMLEALPEASAKTIRENLHLGSFATFMNITRSLNDFYTAVELANPAAMDNDAPLAAAKSSAQQALLKMTENWERAADQQKAADQARALEEAEKLAMANAPRPTREGDASLLQ